MSAPGEPWGVQEYPASKNKHCKGSAFVLIAKPPHRGDRNMSMGDAGRAHLCQDLFEDGGVGLS